MSGRRIRVPARQMAEIEALFVGMLGRARREVIDRLVASSSTLVASVFVPDPDGVFDLQAWMRDVETSAEPAIRKLVWNAATSSGFAVSFDLFDPAISRAVAEHVAGIEKWGEHLRADVSATISKGVAEGMSIDDLTTSLADKASLSEKRARAIARTEAVAAANGGTLQAWKAAGVVTKQWLATSDPRTRETHLNANGQRASVEGLFNVGGFDAEYPGDPRLPVQERANCRCTFIDADVADRFTAASPGAHHHRHQPRRPVPLASLHDSPEARMSTATAEVEAAFEADFSTKGMIALYPADPAALAVPDIGHPAEELHVTLAFLGDVSSVDEDTVTVYRTAMESGAASYPGPIDATVSGVGQLGEEGAVVLFLESAGVMVVHSVVHAELDDAGVELPDQHPGFIPHLTLGYPADDAQRDQLLAAGRALMGSTFPISMIGLDLGDNPVEIMEIGTVPEVPGEPDPEEPETEDPEAEEPPVDPAAATTMRFDTTGEAVSGDAPVDTPEGVPTAEAVPTTDGTMRWRGPIVVEDVDSGDGRRIAPGALTWRELPLTLMSMFRNPDGGLGHAAAEASGRIDNIWRDEANPNLIWGEGVYDDDEVGRRAYAKLKTRSLRGVSVDLCDLVAEYEPPADEMSDGKLTVISAAIMGATHCAFPAFAEAHIEVFNEDDEVIVASSGERIMARVFSAYDSQLALVASGPAVQRRFPVRPPLAWFQAAPANTDPYPVRVNSDGRIHGFVAAWDSCHISFPDRCVRPPRSSCNYAEYRKGEVETAEGVMVATGPVMTDTVHPNKRMRASDAQAFYADTGCAAGDIVAYDLDHGIYVAGAMRSSATDEQVRILRASDWSPDWRKVQGRPGIECLAMLAVNNSGFKVPLTLVASAGGEVVMPGTAPSALVVDGELVTLVAAGGIERHEDDGADWASAFAVLASEVGELRQLLLPFRRERARNRLAAHRGT